MDQMVVPQGPQGERAGHITAGHMERDWVGQGRGCGADGSSAFIAVSVGRTPEAGEQASESDCRGPKQHKLALGGQGRDRGPSVAPVQEVPGGL